MWHKLCFSSCVILTSMAYDVLNLGRFISTFIAFSEVPFSIFVLSFEFVFHNFEGNLCYSFRKTLSLISAWRSWAARLCCFQFNLAVWFLYNTYYYAVSSVVHTKCEIKCVSAAILHNMPLSNRPKYHVTRTYKTFFLWLMVAFPKLIHFPVLRLMERHLLTEEDPLEEELLSHLQLHLEIFLSVSPGQYMTGPIEVLCRVNCW